MQAWGLVEFDLSDILAEDIVIELATLEVYEGQVGSYGAAVNCQRIKTVWVEASVIWASRPQLGSRVWDSVVGDGAPGWWVFDITEQVQLWVDGEQDNNGVALVHSPGCTFPIVYSSDYTADPDLRPILTIDYSPRTEVEEVSWGQIKATF
ncbi:MAG: hypothetical protein A2Y64_01715 [Candidatus Coatesbacteria bacterium RBG_13_66_14]|uniref:Carbohydrate-binding module family 96 domain-containing protein n=1 Tax=Candidatus Coatesbacteria bacterium RBG_13_66_14 TaxID=1817816 RepID=A0A1F5F4C7_9BACT|nr:MAG: hypothetical protein A2Y64_01715 [Candidatus Coatesbacteria bacterium RBG_13_66_14]